MNYTNFEHGRAYVNGGVKLHYRSAGEGNTVLLLHGWLGTSYTWRHVAPLLVEAGFRVVAPDMRGYGDSDKPSTGYDGLTLVEDVRQLLAQTASTSPVHVVGWDMGALPAFLYAAHFPSEVLSLTYLDEPLPGVNLADMTTFRKETFGGYWHFGFNHAADLPEMLISGHEREFWQYLHGLMLFNPASITDEDRQEYLRTYAGPGGIRGSVGWYRDALTTTDQFAEVIARGKLTLPVLGLGGQYGTSYVYDQMKAVAEHVEGGIIPNCGHMVAEEAPEFLANAMVSFFRRLGQPV
jgi:pimeloyl-ACP methyl ester carboxylesterase